MAQPQPESTALTVQARAALALGAAEHEKKLVELAKGSTAIVAITNTASYQECHGARMALKRARLEIEEIGESAREDARNFAKAVIAEQKRLIGIVEPEELRLQGIQDAHDAKLEAERQARARAEEERIAKIQAGIEEIKMMRVAAAGESSARIAALMDELEARGDCAWAQEFQGAAEAAKVATMNRLNEMHAAVMDQEAEAARLKLEREELERRRAEQDERERAEATRLAEETKKRDAEERDRLDRIAAEEREAKNRIAEQEREARVARDAEDARLKAERQRLDDDRRALEQKARDEQFAKDEAARALRLEEQRKREAEENARDEARREKQRQENEILDATAMLLSFKSRFGHVKAFAGLIRAIDAYTAKAEKVKVTA